MKLVSFGGAFFILRGERGVVDGSIYYAWENESHRACGYAKLSIGPSLSLCSITVVPTSEKRDPIH